MARRDDVPLPAEELLAEIRLDLEYDDLQAIQDRVQDIRAFNEWLDADRFDRRAVNHRLQQYSTNDPAWRQG